MSALKTRIRNLFLVLVCMRLLAIPAVAQTFINLHNFIGSDGLFPYGALISSGNKLYGTTEQGGYNTTGTIFAMNTNGTCFTNLYIFNIVPNFPPAANSGGGHPYAGLIFAGSTLYGTAHDGGNYGYGTVFAINTDGTGFTTVHDFNSGDGANPYAGLMISGNILYGTTYSGGDSGYGTVFKVNTDGSCFTNVYNFTGGSDGASPRAGLVLSGSTLYGTTSGGGSSSNGTVFAINTDGTCFTNLHNFTNSNGSVSGAGFFLSGNSLILSGNTLYGAADSGNSYLNINGAVFAINTDGTGFTNLYSFTATSGPDSTNTDGADPKVGLILSGDTLYGTAIFGGSVGDGTVFSLSLPVASAPSLSIAITSVPSLTTNSTGIFIFASSLGVGVTPASVVAFKNVDGNVDLVCANASSGSLTVLTNNGGGIFTSNASYSVGAANSSPQQVVAADINGDDKVDLICANQNTNTLTVYTNNGSGGFVLASTPSVGTGNPAPTSVAAFTNVDGKVDLVSANANTSTLSILTNNGSGGFALASLPVVGSNPYSVIAADVSGNGRMDLISANFGNGGTLSVLTNNGSGGFVLAATYPVGTNPRSVVAADVNGDGKVDLISANTGADTLTVYTNNGSGGFALSGTYGVGSQPWSVTAADINGDGKVDLISANEGTDTLTIYTNSGSGGFTLASTLTVGSGPESAAVVDVNNSGLMDLISANANVHTLTVLTNTQAARTNIANGTVISWPSPSTGFVLQQNSDLSTTNWTTSGLTIFDNGTTKSATNSPVTGSQFFRLIYP